MPGGAAVDNRALYYQQQARKLLCLIIVKKQLEKDEFLAKRENLNIKTVQGNMQDLSVFQNE